MPMPHGSQAGPPPTLEVTVAEMVFACNELKANGKQTIRMIANQMPSQRALRPRCM
jgi:hypothetical protein